MLLVFHFTLFYFILFFNCLRLVQQKEETVAKIEIQTALQIMEPKQKREPDANQSVWKHQS